MNDDLNNSNSKIRDSYLLRNKKLLIKCFESAELQDYIDNHERIMLKDFIEGFESGYGGFESNSPQKIRAETHLKYANYLYKGNFSDLNEVHADFRRDFRIGK